MRQVGFFEHRSCTGSTRTRDLLRLPRARQLLRGKHERAWRSGADIAQAEDSKFPIRTHIGSLPCPAPSSILGRGAFPTRRR
jgi:hypothetical protein